MDEAWSGDDAFGGPAVIVPAVDVAAQHAELADEIEPLVLDVLRSGHYVGGSHVRLFERAYAEAIGVGHCIGVGNGTDAIELALRAVDVAPGDEVIVPGNTFIATAEAVSRIGAIPVPVDVDADHLLLSPAHVADAMTERTRAIVPVHLYGQVAPVDEIVVLADAHGVAVIEDAAQAQGARRHGKSAGAWGRVAATSLYPGKNLGAIGDAGAVTTDDAGLAERVRLMANHGSRVKYDHEVVGMNSRLDALHAAVLTVKLRHLPEWNDRRRALAARYTASLGDLAGVTLPGSIPGNEHVWHLYVVRVPDRAAVTAAFAAAGIEAGVHYPQPWYLSPAYAHLGHGQGTCPVTERAAPQILSLPIHPHLTAVQQDLVIETLRSRIEAA